MAKPKSKVTRIPIAQIRVDGGTQSREQVDADTVTEYQATYAKDTTTMPPVVVFFNGTTYWLADGFHRIAAARAAGHVAIETDVRQGTQRDAVLFSVGANATHGLPRSNADKRRAVLLLLGDKEWARKSDRWIAKACAVSDHFVGAVRKSGAIESQLPASERQGKDGKTYKLPTKPAKPPGTVTPSPTLSLTQWKAAAGVVSLGGDAVEDCGGRSARQAEPPTTASVRVEPQPERSPLTVAVSTREPDDDDDDDYPVPKGVVLAQVYNYILQAADEWNSEWNFRDLINQVMAAARHLEHRHEERNRSNG